MELTLASNAALVYTTAYTDVGKQLHTLPSQISHSTLRQPQMRNENNIPFIFVSQISPYQLNLGNWFCVWRRRKKGMLLSSSYFVSCMRSNNGTAFNGDAFVSAVINPHLTPDWQLVFHSKFTSLEVRVKLPEYQGEHSTNVFMSCKNAGKQLHEQIPHPAMGKLDTGGGCKPIFENTDSLTLLCPVNTHHSN